MNGMMEYNAGTGYSSRAPHLIPYGTGRLWVEGVGKEPFLGEVSGASGRQIGKRRKAGEDSKTDPLVTLPSGHQGVMSRDIIGENWLEEGEWAYYDQPEQVNRTGF